MEAKLDHVVLWVEDPLRSLSFYGQVIGLESLRAGEFQAGEAPFPSVRVSPETLIDLVARDSASAAEKDTNAKGTAGHTVNHICLAMSQPEYEALIKRLEENGVDTSARLAKLFGARGFAPNAFYFRDPDNNVIEARYYA